MDKFEISKILAQDSINKAITIYGLEGCEEVIKRVYSLMPTIRDLMLKEYKKLIWRK